MVAARLEILANATRLSTKTRRATIDGREYIVAPVTMLVPGVLNGSQGALFYPAQEVARNYDAWNGMPLVVRHPTINGVYVSARRPDVLQNYGIGWVYNAHIYKDNLKGEGWFDIEKTRKVDNALLTRLESGQPIEVSTGLFTENTLADNGASHNGKPYAYVARNYKPDHLAILPDEQGACSVNDGCGINVNAAKKTQLKHKGGSYVDEKGNPCPPGECCPHCGARQERGDDGKCNRCGKDWPLTANEWTDAARHASIAARQAKSNVHANKLSRIAEKASKEADNPPPGQFSIHHSRAGIAHSKASEAHLTAARRSITAGKMDDHAAHMQAYKKHAEAAFDHHMAARGMKVMNQESNDALEVLVTNAKKPSKQLDMSPDKACKILKDGTVHGKPLTDSQKGMFGALCGESKTNNSSNSLTVGANTMDRTEKITYITANCDCWKGAKGKEALAILTDNEIDKIKEDVDRRAVMNTFITNVKAKFGDKVLTANADDMEKGMMEKCKELMGQQTATVPATNKETELTTNRLTPEEQEDLAFARAEKLKQKASLITKITANVSDPAQKQAKQQSLAKKSLTDLQEIADLIPDVPVTNVNDDNPLSHIPIQNPMYLGAAGGPPVLNRVSSKEDEENLPVLPKVDWAAEQKLLNNRQRQE
jgi:hypothetical protein